GSRSTRFCGRCWKSGRRAMGAVDDGGPHLLARDRDAVDRAARILARGDPALVVLAGARALWPAILAGLRESVADVPAKPLALVSEQQALDVLSGNALREAPGVLVIALDGDRDRVIQTLNWHREKLRRGRPVVILLDGAGELEAFRT